MKANYLIGNGFRGYFIQTRGNVYFFNNNYLFIKVTGIHVLKTCQETLILITRYIHSSEMRTRMSAQ